MFLDNYAETHAILLPGRIPGYKNWDVKLLPSQMTKNSVWLEYVHAHAAFTVRIVSYRSFCRLWQRYRPSLIITKPKSDLCWECQQNSATITASFNKSEEEKIMVIMVFKINSKLKIKIHHNKYYNTFIDPDKSNRPYQQSTNRKKLLQSSMAHSLHLPLASSNLRHLLTSHCTSALILPNNYTTLVTRFSLDPFTS